MEKKIYLKLYIYAFIILITSIILTSVVITFYFHQSNENKSRFNPFLLNFGKISQICLNDSFDKGFKNFKSRMHELNDLLKCSISYWKENKLEYYVGVKPTDISYEHITKLKKEKITKIISNAPPRMLIYLDEKNIDKGLLLLEFDRRDPLKKKPPDFNFLRFLGLPGAPPGQPPQQGTPPPFGLPISPAFLTFLFLAFLLIPYSLYVLKPFKSLMKSINKIAQGDLTYPIQISKNSEFKELALAFERMQTKIQEMINQKQELIADVSHELRSPLTRIRMCLEILAQNPEEKDEYIRQAVSEIKDLDSLIDDLLEISRLELATSTLHLETVDLKSILAEQIEKHQLLLDNIKVTLKQDLPGESVYISADKELLKRVFNNFFSNLLKYSPYESIADISLKKADDKVYLSIRNRGPAIKKDEYEKIFEPFYRPDKSRVRETGGTGLGLAITKKIISAHNGKIWVTSPDDAEGGVIFNLQFFGTLFHD